LGTFILTKKIVQQLKEKYKVNKDDTWSMKQMFTNNPPIILQIYLGIYICFFLSLQLKKDACFTVLFFSAIIVTRYATFIILFLL